MNETLLRLTEISFLIYRDITIALAVSHEIISQSYYDLIKNDKINSSKL